MSIYLIINILISQLARIFGKKKYVNLWRKICEQIHQNCFINLMESLMKDMLVSEFVFVEINVLPKQVWRCGNIKLTRGGTARVEEHGGHETPSHMCDFQRCSQLVTRHFENIATFPINNSMVYETRSFHSKLTRALE